MLCAIWFTASVLSNTSSKTILTAFSKPVTLTLVQFWFVSTWCLFAAWLAQRVPLVRRSLPLLKDGIRWPTKALVRSALPLAAFQVGGHILSSDAMAKMSVPLVHTIKGLSPLFTVLAYRLFFGVRYSTSTYLALVPLILGVMMACSANFSANFVGLSYALGSALLFVTQNIVSKKLFNDAAAAEYDTAPVRFRKPDKLNLLCYSSGIAFLTTIPLWLWSEGFGIMSEVLQDASVNLSTKPGAVDHGRLALEFIFNGVFHFVQNMVAFVLLSMVSPVTYSVASLFKRVFVILFALVWFGNRMTTVQAVGIALTFVGLYLYDRCGDATRVERSGERVRSGRGSEILPVVTERKTEQFHANHK